ncbi:MAG: hypothetical protein ABSE25_02510 [Syntrophorhabdales bacterium]|jgi:hypothetical protein
MRRRLMGLIALMLVLVPGMVLPSNGAGGDAYPAETQGGPYAQEEPIPAPSGDTMIVDLFFVRPVSFLALLIGTGTSILATPFALATGTTGPVYERLVVEPYYFLVCRPLGQF